MKSESPPAASSLSSAATTTAPAALGTLAKASLLGSYHPSHDDRASLSASSASDRNTAANSLTAAVGAVPDESPQETADYQTEYNTAYTQAAGDMGSTAAADTYLS